MFLSENVVAFSKAKTKVQKCDKKMIPAVSCQTFFPEGPLSPYKVISYFSSYIFQMLTCKWKNKKSNLKNAFVHETFIKGTFFPFFIINKVK